jgi:hypothetical protein
MASGNDVAYAVDGYPEYLKILENTSKGVSVSADINKVAKKSGFSKIRKTYLTKQILEICAYRLYADQTGDPKFKFTQTFNLTTGEVYALLATNSGNSVLFEIEVKQIRDTLTFTITKAEKVQKGIGEGDKLARIYTEVYVLKQKTERYTDLFRDGMIRAEVVKRLYGVTSGREIKVVNGVIVDESIIISMEGHIRGSIIILQKISDGKEGFLFKGYMDVSETMNFTLE